MALSSNANSTSYVWPTLALANSYGLQLGQVVQQNKNSPNYQMLVQNNPSGGNIAANAAVKWTTGEAGAFQVDPTAATTDVCIGANDQAAAIITAGECFWIGYKGQVSPLVENGVGQGAVLSPSATAGVLNTTGGDNQGNISTAAAQSGAGNTPTLCWFA